jgi:hypothetical protein
MAQGLDAAPDAFDELLADQLLDPTEIESLPESYRLLADVLAAARAPTLEGELVSEPEAVSLFRANRLTNGATSASSRKRRVRQLTVLLAAGGLTVATASATAAATGSLPDDVQDFASSMLSKFGISVPRGHRISPEPPARPSAVESSTPSATIPVPPTDDDGRISGLTTNLSAVPVDTATARSSSPPADPAASPAKAHRAAPRHDGPASPPTTVPPSPAKAHPPAPSDDPPSAPNAAPPAPLEDAPASPPAADPPSPSPGGPPPSRPGGPPTSPPGGPPPSRSPADPPSPSPGGPPPSRPGGPPTSAPGGPPPSPPAADPRSPGGPSPSPPGGPPPSPPEGRPSSPTGGRP